MPRTIRSALFKHQFLDGTAGYREGAGSDIATKFVDQIEDTVRFVASKP